MEREYVAIFISGDGGRTMVREIFAVDIDGATGQAMALVDGGEFGKGAVWFVGAVVQADYVAQVGARLEVV